MKIAVAPRKVKVYRNPTGDTTDPRPTHAFGYDIIGARGSSRDTVAGEF